MTTSPHVMSENERSYAGLRRAQLNELLRNAPPVIRQFAADVFAHIDELQEALDNDTEHRKGMRLALTRCFDENMQLMRAIDQIAKTWNQAGGHPESGAELHAIEQAISTAMATAKACGWDGKPL